MKSIHRALRAAAAMMILLSAAILSACSFYSFSVDSLIRPPKLTGENALIEQAFEKAVNAEVLLISPIAGDYRTAFVPFDVDADGEDETLVFYAKKESPNEAHLHLLKYDGETWRSAGDITGNGSEVYSVAFYNFDQQASYEVAVCWTVSDTRRNKTLSLYKLEDVGEAPEMIPLSVIQLYDYLILDFDSDGQPELMYLMDNSSDPEQPFKVSMIKMDKSDEAFHFICELSLHQSVSLPVQMCYDVRVQRYTLYIDCLNTDGSYMTEIIYYDTENEVFSRMQNEAQAELSELTVRNTQVYCSDIDNDRLIEVPLQKEWIGSTVLYPEAENALPMYITEFHKRRDRELIPLASSYFYAPDGTFRMKTDAFMDSYVAVYDAVQMTMSFYATDETDQPIFMLKYVPFAEKEAAFYVEITEPEMTQFTESFIKSFAEIL